MDFRQYYNLESYLLNTVRPRFIKQGYLSAFDFFCIVIWKVNRAKSKIAKKLLAYGYKNLNLAVRALTKGLIRQSTAKDRLCYLRKKWDIPLPTASAILTILYPKEFTVYDIRVCNRLGRFHKLKNRKHCDNLWKGYEKFRGSVEKSVPNKLTLRDKDRYLWGESFYKQLQKDIKDLFKDEQPDDA